MIQLITKKGGPCGEVLINGKAKRGVTVQEVLEIAEHEVMDGYADYAAVLVDGKIYAEYEF